MRETSHTRVRNWTWGLKLVQKDKMMRRRGRFKNAYTRDSLSAVFLSRLRCFRRIFVMLGCNSAQLNSLSYLCLALLASITPDARL
jgi:hypothetical protein